MIRATGVEWVPENTIFVAYVHGYMLYRNKSDIMALYETFVESFYTKKYSYVYFHFEPAGNVENLVKHIESSLLFCHL
jgi:hypothetical protein